MKIIHRVVFMVLLPAALLLVGCDCDCEDDPTVDPATAGLCRLDHGPNTAAVCVDTFAGVCVDVKCLNCDNCELITSDSGPANAAAEALFICAP